MSPFEQDEARYVRVAGFWLRSLAAIIDLLVISPALLACAWVLRLVLPMPSGSEAELAAWLLEMLIERHPLILAAGGFAIAVSLAYIGVFTVACGQTLGQKLLGLHVIDDQGRPPSMAAVTLRTCALPVGLFFMGLGSLWIAFDREARGFHDHVAGTFVVRRARAAAPEADLAPRVSP
jgi:uncharacterized RDD family membrane protein YckC